MERLWRIADKSDLAWRHWDGEYVFHHALSNDTHRLSDLAGEVLLYLLKQGEMAQERLADELQLDPQDLDVILTALVKIHFVAWR